MKSFFVILLSLIFCIEGFAFSQVSQKTYSQMSEAEKDLFISEQSNKVLEQFGRVEGDKINEKGLKLIRQFVDDYAARPTSKKTDRCSFGNDLTTVLTRGGQYAKNIGDEFSKINLPSQTGIYVAMIESEFCPCLQSPTGSLGMFQFTSAVGNLYDLKVQKGATPQNPDERCEPQLSARAAAKYIQSMIMDKFDNQANAIGYPLAIASFNSGEAATQKHIKAVAGLGNTQKIGFWMFLDTSNEIAAKTDQGYMEQFQTENYKYVPKFFAAAIVGENPQIFGVNISPLRQSK